MNLYMQNRAFMKSGDVIAFSGNSRISKIIKWKTNSPYSHVGIVLDTIMQEPMGKAVLMIESTALCNIPDEEGGRIINGVQMHFLSRRLESYNGSAWWFPLKDILPPYAAFNMQSWLREKRSQYVPYDAVQVLGAGMDFFDWFPGFANESDFSSLFCSELVAKALQVAGVVNEDINPSEQTPADVVAMPCFGKAVRVK